MPSVAKADSGSDSGKAAQPQAAGESTKQKASDAASRNNPPAVKDAKFRFETVKGVDVLKVVAEGEDRDGDQVTFTYEWTINDKPAGGGDTVSGFKRGDRVSVNITPFDGKGIGIAKIATMDIVNTTPRIIEHREMKFDGKVWSYQVKAVDADGDTLTYSLKEAPQGMTINPRNGLIQWNVPQEFEGKAPITVSVSDGHGGEVLYGLEAIIESEGRK